MLDNLDRFFRRQKEGRQTLNLFDEALLGGLVGRIEAATIEERHLLQVTLYEKLLKCDLLLPVPSGTDTQREIPILAMENILGERGMPLFTNERTMELWADEGTDYVALPFPMLCRYAVEAGIDFLLLNVAGPHGCEIGSYDFHFLADSLLPPPPAPVDYSRLDGHSAAKPGEMVIAQGTPMRLGLCEELSPGLMDRLNHTFATHRELIARVYLFTVAFNDGPLQPALGVRVNEGAEIYWDTELWPDLQAVLHEMLERRAVINVFLLNHSGSMESHVAELTNPVFGESACV